jgi:hypothetical protein
MLTHLCFDIETLGMHENTVILTLACVPFIFEQLRTFTDYLKDGLMIKFDATEQLNVYKRTVCKRTIDWWKMQGIEARKASVFPSSEDMTVKDGLQLLSDFIKKSGYSYGQSYVWSRGTYFDFPKIENLYEDANLKLPYNGYKIRDIKTYVDIFLGRNDGQYDSTVPTPDGFVKHNCLHDAARDASGMTQIYSMANEGD